MRFLGGDSIFSQIHQGNPVAPYGSAIAKTANFYADATE